MALAALVAEIAAWQAARGRDHQAAAARRTATDATELVLDHPAAARPSPPTGTSPHPSSAPSPALPGATPAASQPTLWADRS